MRDMGLKTTRTRNPIKEFMAPFNPGMYKGLTAELRALTQVEDFQEKALVLEEV